MDDDAILAGVPDNVEPMGDDEMVMEAADDEAERAAARARQMAAEAEEDEREAARARQMAAEAEDDEAIMAEEEAEAGTAMPKKIGKRKIIKYAVDPSMLTGGTGGGVPELDEAEMERRRARAEKFGMPMPGAEGAPAAPVHVQHEMLTLEEIAKREERAKKFGIEGVDSGPTQFQKDPLASIMSLAGGNAYWEKRRDAKEDETVRPEAIHVFGTDRLSTEDLLLYFIEPNVTPEDQAPRWVEWVNDSSANVVFGTPEACGGAALAKTVPLMPNAQGIDTQSWRTMPDSQAGKGLQLLFRIATVLDVKPAKRQASRWYGEAEVKGNRRNSGGKMGGVQDRRDRRKSGSDPYGRSGGGGPTKEMREEARARAIAAQELSSGKKSLAEMTSMRTAEGPGLAEVIQRASGPTLADMASLSKSGKGAGMNTMTLADMAGAANADVASGRKVEMVGGGGGGGNDLRSLLKSKGRNKPKANHPFAVQAQQAAASSDEPLGGTMSYAAVQAEQAAQAPTGMDDAPVDAPASGITEVPAVQPEQPAAEYGY